MNNPDRFAQLVMRLLDGIGRLTRPTGKVRLRPGYTKRGPNLVIGRGRRKRRPKSAWTSVAIVVGTLLLLMALLILAAS